MGPGPRDGKAPGEVGLIILLAFTPGHAVPALAWLSLGRFALRNAAGLVFFKILGSGRDAGFGVTPGLARQGIFCAFRSEAHADAFIANSAVMTFLRARTSELFCAKLRAISSRGLWSGRVPLSVTAVLEPGAPVASLTRASIRPAKALSFWRHAAPAEASLQAAHGCLVAAGLGEIPLLRQATFTIWDGPASMDAFARTGAHLEAIRAARHGAYFTEDLFARLRPYEMTGSWKGRGF